MELANIVSVLGLSLDIFGAILLFKYGMPSKVHESGGSFLVAATSPQDEAKEKREFKIYQSHSKLGIVLLVFGFMFQLVAQFL